MSLNNAVSKMNNSFLKMAQRCNFKILISSLSILQLKKKKKARKRRKMVD